MPNHTSNIPHRTSAVPLPRLGKRSPMIGPQKNQAPDCPEARPYKARDVHPTTLPSLIILPRESPLLNGRYRLPRLCSSDWASLNQSSARRSHASLSSELTDLAAHSRHSSDCLRYLARSSDMGGPLGAAAGLRPLSLCFRSPPNARHIRRPIFARLLAF
jgi:hypothetical protein